MIRPVTKIYKYGMLLLGITLILAACYSGRGKSIVYRALTLKAAAGLTGDFVDDYGITYTITDSVFIQAPGIKYNIIRWDTAQQFFIASKTSRKNEDSLLFSRIDYMRFTGTEPWLWGYCFTFYTAKTEAEALNHPAADRNNPKKGCNGFPFSRMKRQ